MPRLALLAFCLALLPAPAFADCDSRGDRKQCEKEWTVLVYMEASNDLFPYALWDLYEMEAAFRGSAAAASSARADLVVEVNGPAPDDRRRLHMRTGPEAYAQKRKSDFTSLAQIHSPLVMNVAEGGTERAHLEDFLLWGAQNYPAKRTFVIVWGHGQGWRAYPDDKNFAGFTAPDAGLDIPAISSALETFRAVTGKEIDVYASDSCFMQMLEVTYELSAHARFLVGSSQVQTYLGLPYRRLMYELNSGRFNGLRGEISGVDQSDEAYLLAKMIPGLVAQGLDPQRGLQGRLDPEANRFFTSSSLSGAELRGPLLPALRGLARALEGYLAESPFHAMDLLSIHQSVPLIAGSAQDLGVFLGYLDVQVREGKTPAAARLRGALASAKAALDRSVLAYEYGSAYGVDERTRQFGFVPRALSLWLPKSPTEYKLRREEFLRSRFYADSQWQTWLDALFPR